MTADIANFVQQRSLSIGNGAMTVTAVPGRRGFFDAFGGSGPDAFFYFISHADMAEWEVGTGHMQDAATLIRDTVIESSTGGGRVNFSGGIKEIVNDVPATRQRAMLQLSSVALSGSYNDLSARPVIALPSARRSRPRVAVIGSSYTQQQHVQSGAGTVLSSQSRSWLTWWNVLTGNALNIDTFLNSSDPYGRGFSGTNFGISGQTSTQILARVGDVIAKKPDICVIQSGSNNVASVETVVADVMATIDQLYAVGILPVFVAITFRGTTSWTLTNQKQASQINARIQAYLAATGRGIFVEANKYLSDPDQAEGRPYPVAVDTDDIHYNTWSAFQVGRALHEALSPLLAPRTGDIVANADVYDAVNNPFGNQWVNPFVSIASTIGSTAGSVGTGVTAGTGNAATAVGRNITVERLSGTGTAVANIESRGPGRGNFQTVTVTPAGGSGTSLFVVRHSPADVVHGLAAGTWVRAGCTVDLSTFGSDIFSSGFQNISVSVDFRDTVGSKGKTQALAQYTAISLPNIAWQGALETPPFRIPTGSDRFRMRLEVTVDDSKTGTGLVKSGGFYLRPCADPTAVW